MSRLARGPRKAWQWMGLGALACGLLVLAGGAYLYRQQMRATLQTTLRETAELKNQQVALDKLESADTIGRFGALADAARAHIRQSTVEISDALEGIKREETAPLRLSYRIQEPQPREKAVAGLQVADRQLAIEFGTVTEAPITAFLERLPQSLNGALHVQQLEIERKLTFDDDLVARLALGERPDVLLTRVQLRIGAIGGPAPVSAAPSTTAPSAKPTVPAQKKAAL